MKLFALSDLHLHYKENCRALEGLREYPDDWIILAGDVGEQAAQLDYALRLFTSKFARVIWLPGNHELWSFPSVDYGLAGESKYRLMVEVCRHHEVLTPEDPFAVWPGEGGPFVIAPLFNLFDYSFRPDYVLTGQEIAWASESGIISNDEEYLQSKPYADIPSWCDARIAVSEKKMEESLRLRPNHRLILANHFPLSYEDAYLPRIPSFSIWCGTRRTSDWHKRFNAALVIYGHLHMRRTHMRDGTRFEEVSFGNPGQWDGTRDMNDYLREILPGKDHRPESSG